MIHHSFPCLSPSETKYFKFLNHANINDSWFSPDSSVIFTCDSVAQISILNETDSVKYFNINKTKPFPYQGRFPFILSKHHGLIEFAPFSQLLFDLPGNAVKAILAGYEQGSKKAGTVIPPFDSFFRLSAGDLLYWHYTYETSDIMQKNISEYYKDSIINAIKTSDSVIYDVISNNVFFKHKYIFNKNEYSEYLEAGTNSALFNYNGPFGNGGGVKSYWLPEHFYVGDTFSTLSFEWDGVTLDTTICRLNMHYDIENDFEIDSRFGLIRYCDYASDLEWYNTCNYLVGAIIDGVKWGVTDIPTGIKIPEINNIQIFPNPFNDRIFIKNFGNKKINFKITDIAGKIVLQGSLNYNQR